MWHVRSSLLLSLLLGASCGHVMDEVADAPSRDAPELPDAPPDTPSLPALPDGLVAWYPMNSLDGTRAVDATGHGHDGTCVDTACPTLTTPGRIDDAYLFDGVDDLVTVPSAADFREPFTVAAWISLDHKDQNGCFLNKAIRDVGNNSWQACVQTGDKIGFRSNDSDSSSPSHVLQSPTTMVAGAWYHVAMWWDGEIKKLYFEGVEVAASTAPVPIAFDDHPITIGADIDAGQLVIPFKGRIDDVQIYKRAISAAEIMTLAAGKAELRAPANQLR